MKTKVLLIMIFASLFSACAAPSIPQSVETESAAADVPVMTEPTLPTNENPTAMTTYTDDIAGFLLDYPAGWFLETSVLVHAEEVDNYSISISSWDMNNPPAMGANGLPGDGTKFDVTVVKDATTLEAAVEDLRRTGTPILEQRDITLANGVPCKLIDFEGFAGRSQMLISIINGNFIYVTGYGDLEPYESVALSLRAR